jgi:ureidoglycolate lyase
MTTLVPVKVQLLTPDAFAPYGEVLGIQGRVPDFTGISSVGWKSGFECNGPPEVMLYSSRYSGLRFSMLERHHAVTQSFVPLRGVPAVVAVVAPTPPGIYPQPDDVRAFLLDGSTGYVLHRDTWHSLDRFPLYPPSSEIVIITSRETQVELESVPPQEWRLTEAIDYEATLGVTFALEL